MSRLVRERHPHDRVHPVAARRRAAGGVRAARRGRRAEARADQVVPRRLPGGGSPEASSASWRTASCSRSRPRTRSSSGIDIGSLDAAVLTGYPGTRASMWQQAGGRAVATTDSLAMLVAQDDPLDQYLVHHPEDLFDKPAEAAVIDPTNPYVLEPHLRCAARELPLREDELGVLRGRAGRRDARSSGWSSAKSWCGAGRPGTTAAGSRRTASVDIRAGGRPRLLDRDRRDRRAAGHRRRAPRVRDAASRAPSTCTRASSTWSTSSTWCTRVARRARGRSRLLHAVARHHRHRGGRRRRRRQRPATSTRSSARCASRTRS